MSIKSPNFPPLGSGGSEGGGKLGDNELNPVETFADLPSAAANSGKVAFVLKPTGSYLFFNKKKAGYYVSDGSVWRHNGAVIQRVDVADNIPDDGTGTDADGIPILGATYDTNTVYHYTPADIEAIATTGEGNSEAIAWRHQHDNKAILDATEASFTQARADKLDSLDSRFRGIYETTAEGITENDPPQGGWYFRSEETQTIWIYKVADGTWIDTQSASVGDMQSAVYDPTGVNADAFDRANHTGEIEITDVNNLAQRISDLQVRATNLERDANYKHLTTFRWGSLGTNWVQHQMPNASNQFQFIYKKSGNNIVIGFDSDTNEAKNMQGSIRVYNGVGTSGASWTQDQAFATIIDQDSDNGIVELAEFDPSVYFYLEIKVSFIDRGTATTIPYDANTQIYDIIIITDGYDDGSNDVGVFYRQLT